MMSIILSELQSWRLKFSKYSLIVLILTLSIVSILSLLKPVLSIQVITVFLLWLGWLSGKQSWSEIKYNEWINQSKISIKSLITGKILSVVLITLIHLFYIFPIFIIMIIMRGLPIQVFLLAIFSMIFSTLISSCLTFLFNCIENNDFQYFGTFILILWLITSLFVPVLKFINPIIQIKFIFEAENSIFILFGIVINISLILLFSTFTGFFLNLKQRV